MFRSLRVSQIRLASALLEFLGRRRGGREFIVRLRNHPLTRSLARFIVGYRSTFSSFAEAQRYASRFLFVGHEHPENVAYHSGLADSAPRESDYPVIFYLTPIVERLQRVFDLGGNVGNLFYTLQRDLHFSEQLVWHVCDLPKMLSAGAELAKTKNEQRLRFTDDFSAASGCDLFIASGCLHYFERPLAEMLSSLELLPKHLVINRTPCTRENVKTEEDMITVQDGGTFLMASKVHNHGKLIASLTKIGYLLRGSWPVYERRLWVPLYPDLSSEHYQGFYFVRSNSTENR